jgi:hypothetical protein
LLRGRQTFIARRRALRRQRKRRALQRVNVRRLAAQKLTLHRTCRRVDVLRTAASDNRLLCGAGERGSERAYARYGGGDNGKITRLRDFACVDPRDVESFVYAKDRRISITLDTSNFSQVFVAEISLQNQTFFKILVQSTVIDFTLNPLSFYADKFDSVLYFLSVPIPTNIVYSCLCSLICVMLMQISGCSLVFLQY